MAQCSSSSRDVGIVTTGKDFHQRKWLVPFGRRKENHGMKNHKGNKETVPMNSIGDLLAETVESSGVENKTTAVAIDVENDGTLNTNLLQMQGTLARRGRFAVAEGLTKLDNKMYVAYSLSSKIDVYATTKPSYTLLNSIDVKGLKDPHDIALCTINSCLYVADWDRANECIWKVGLSKDHTVDKWLSVRNVWSLSITSDGDIVVLIRTVCEGGESISDCGTVKVYAADDGGQLSSIELPSDIDKPCNVVQTVDKSFIVCHGGSTLHRVCKVNNDGILKAYGGSRGSEPGHLDHPQYIALDKEERIFVADHFNRRVLLLDKQLDFQRVLLTWLNDWPWYLFYDRDTTQLTVLLEPDDSADKVEIYSL